jgi:ankyrin repeat protein
VELIEAASAGDAERVRALLAGGAPVDAADDQGRTALHHAVVATRLEVVDLLLGAGADVDRRAGVRRQTPLALACSFLPWLGGSVRVLERLLDAGADAEAEDEHGDRPVHSLVAWDDEAPLRLLAERGAALAPPGPSPSPLSRALAGGHVVAARYLVAQGCTPEPSALLAALGASKVADRARGGDAVGAPLVRDLLSAGAAVDAVAANGLTPLHLAAAAGLAAVVETLLKAGADVLARDDLGARAVHWAAMCDETRVAGRLCDEWRRLFRGRPLAEYADHTEIDRAADLETAGPGDLLALDGDVGPLLGVLAVCGDEPAALEVLDRRFGAGRAGHGPLAIVQLEEVGRQRSAPNLLRVASHTGRAAPGSALWLERVAAGGPRRLRPWGPAPAPDCLPARLAVLPGELAAGQSGGPWYRTRLLRVLSYDDGMCLAWDEIHTGRQSRASGASRPWPP